MMPARFAVRSAVTLLVAVLASAPQAVTHAAVPPVGPLAVGGTGHALRFQGRDKRQEVLFPAFSAADSPSAELSVCLWTRFGFPVGAVASGIDAGYAGVYLGLIAPDVEERGGIQLELQTYNDMRVDIGGAGVSAPLFFHRDDEWHHMCVTWAASDGLLAVHLDAGGGDGARWTSADAPATTTSTSTTASPAVWTDALLGPSYLQLGRPAAVDQPYVGDMDDVCVWKARINGDAAAAVRAQGCSGAVNDTASLLLDVRFDRDRGEDAEPSVWDDVAGAYRGVRGGLLAGYRRANGAVGSTYHVPSSLPVVHAGRDLVTTFVSGRSAPLLLGCEGGCDNVTIASLPLPSQGSLFQLEGGGAAITAPGTLVLPTSDGAGGSMWAVVFAPAAGATAANFSYSGYRAADNSSASALVKLTANAPPVSEAVMVTVDQGGRTVATLPAMFPFDADGDRLRVVVDTAPAASTGVALVQLAVPRGAMPCIVYTTTTGCWPPSLDDVLLDAIDPAATPVNVTGAFGMLLVTASQGAAPGDYAFSYHLDDDAAGASASANVTVRVVGVNQPPVPVSAAVATDEDTSVVLTVAAQDADGDTVYTQVSALPTSGKLHQWAAGGTPGEAVALVTGLERVPQWASAATASTEWPIDDPTAINFWAADVIVGPPRFFPKHGEGEWAWQPDEAPGAGFDDYRRQWVEITVAEPVAVESVEVYETWHPGALIRVSSLDPSTQTWVTLWESAPTIDTVDADTTFATITSPPLCPQAYLTTRVRLDFDMVTFEHWIAVDAVRVIGTRALAASVVRDPQARLVYVPDGDTYGADSVAFVVSDCPFYQKSRELAPEARTGTVSVTVRPVNDAPITIAGGTQGSGRGSVGAGAGASGSAGVVFVGAGGEVVSVTLSAADAEDAAVGVVVTALPAAGTIRVVDAATGNAGAAVAAADLPFTVPVGSVVAAATLFAANATQALRAASPVNLALLPTARSLAYDTAGACGAQTLAYHAVDSEGAVSASRTVHMDVQCAAVSDGIGLGLLLGIIAFAAALVLAMGATLWHQLRKHKKVVETMTVEYVDKVLRTASKRVREALRSQIFVQLFFFALEAGDITSDWAAFVSVLDSLQSNDSNTFLVVYTSMLSVGTAVGSVALGVRMSNARSLYRDAHDGIDLSELGVLAKVKTAEVSDMHDAIDRMGESLGSSRLASGFFFDGDGGVVKANNPKHRLRAVSRSLLTLQVTLALALLEDIPMCSLNVYLLFTQDRPPSHSEALIISIMLSALMLGVKLRSVDRLVALRADKAELEGRLAMAAATGSGAGAGTGGLTPKSKGSATPLAHQAGPFVLAAGTGGGAARRASEPVDIDGAVHAWAADESMRAQQMGALNTMA